MDAFCGFVRGIREKSEELGVFPDEMRAFSSQFSITSGRFFLKLVPVWLSPDRSITDSSKTARLHSRKVCFLIGAKATA